MKFKFILLFLCINILMEGYCDTSTYPPNLYNRLHSIFAKKSDSKTNFHTIRPPVETIGCPIEEQKCIAIHLCRDGYIVTRGKDILEEKQATVDDFDVRDNIHRCLKDEVCCALKKTKTGNPTTFKPIDNRSVVGTDSETGHETVTEVKTGFDNSTATETGIGSRTRPGISSAEVTPIWPKIPIESPVTNKPTSSVTPTSPTESNTSPATSDNDDEEVEKEIFLGCGNRQRMGAGFKINTPEKSGVKDGEYPWLVALMKVERDNSMTFRCGGSLITPSVIVTSAHCFYDIKSTNQLAVIAGIHDPQTSASLFPSESRWVLDFKIHENYSTARRIFDIAIVIVSEPFIMRPHIQTICLPEISNNYPSNNATTCVAVGWGKENFGRVGVYSAPPRDVELPVVPGHECEQKIRSTKIGRNYRQHESVLCAGGEKGKDTCSGDGGGPLMCPIQGQTDMYTLTGIISWGYACDGSVPSFYANVPNLRDWIENVVKSKFPANVIEYYTPKI